MRMLCVIIPVDRKPLLTDLVPSLSVLTSNGWMMVPHRGTATTGALAPPQPPTHVNQTSFSFSHPSSCLKDMIAPIQRAIQRRFTQPALLLFYSDNTKRIVQSLPDRCLSVFVPTCSAQQRNTVSKKRAIPNQVLISLLSHTFESSLMSFFLSPHHPLITVTPEHKRA